jgi:hypothetical protein
MNVPGRSDVAFNCAEPKTVPYGMFDGAAQLTVGTGGDAGTVTLTVKEAAVSRLAWFLTSNVIKELPVRPGAGNTWMVRAVPVPPGTMLLRGKRSGSELLLTETCNAEAADSRSDTVKFTTGAEPPFAVVLVRPATAGGKLNWPTPPSQTM